MQILIHNFEKKMEALCYLLLLMRGKLVSLVYIDVNALYCTPRKLMLAFIFIVFFLFKMNQSTQLWVCKNKKNISSSVKFGVFRNSRESFTHLETTPLPLRCYTLWPILDNHGHSAVKVCIRATPTVTRANTILC